ncbi:MAG: hypothetical protein U0361_04255 [Nitrospiraceae bacterium]
MTFVTGHEDPSKGQSGIEWPRLATAHGTLVFLMGMTNLPQIVERLKAEGNQDRLLWRNHPWGTRTTQRTVVATLDDVVSAQVAQMNTKP